MQTIRFFLILLLTSCSFINKYQIQKNIEVITTPVDAKVYVYSTQKKKYIEIGKTPFILDFNDSVKFKEIDMEKPISILVEKNGFVPEHITFERARSSSVNLAVKLKALPFWVDPSSKYSSSVVEDISRTLQRINRSTKTGKLIEAMTDIDSLIARFSYTPMLHDMKGSIYILQGKRALAEKEYAQSLKLNPNNSEARRALEALKR